MLDGAITVDRVDAFHGGLSSGEGKGKCETVAILAAISVPDVRSLNGKKH